MNVGGLFSGIGGIELAFKQNGFKIIWSNEIDKNACVTYKSNHTHQLFNCDIQSLNANAVPDIDILVAGFPCQAFSVAGHQKGFDDARGNLFFDILRFIDAKNPSIIFLENVKNLLNHNNGETFNKIYNEITTRGYFLKYKVLNSSQYGNVPQNRERIYMVAFKDEEVSNRFEFPKPIKLTKKINNLLEPLQSIDEKYYYNKSKYFPILKTEMTSTETLYQWRRTYVRENKNKLCPTLTANMGTGGHNVPLINDTKDIRKLTPRECARFQGYPDSFILPNIISNSALYKQIGNSVTIPVINRIAGEIKKALYI